MSSEIYYDKAFISIGDKYIPLVCHGSNNTYEFNRNGREVAERYWAVLNRPYREEVFISEEIQKIAETCEGFSQDNRGGMRKSRNCAFEAGEFQRWFLAGLKNAHTIEEYRQYGNSVVLTDLHTRKTTYVSAADSFLAELSCIGEQNVDIRFDSCRSFYHPPRVSKQSKFDTLKQFYVLKAWRGYFCKADAARRHDHPHRRSDGCNRAKIQDRKSRAEVHGRKQSILFARSLYCGGVRPKQAQKAA